MQARNPSLTWYPPRLEQGTLCLHVGSLPTEPPLLGQNFVIICLKILFILISNKFKILNFLKSPLLYLKRLILIFHLFYMN